MWPLFSDAVPSKRQGEDGCLLGLPVRVSPFSPAPLFHIMAGFDFFLHTLPSSTVTMQEKRTTARERGTLRGCSTKHGLLLLKSGWLDVCRRFPHTPLLIPPSSSFSLFSSPFFLPLFTCSSLLASFYSSLFPSLHSGLDYTCLFAKNEVNIFFDPAHST